MTVAGEYSAVFDAAEQAWRDALAAIPRMPIVLATGALVVLVPRFLPLGPGWITNPNPDQLFWFRVYSYSAYFLTAIAQGAFLTPVAIAVHRFVLLGEVTRAYTLKPLSRIKRFFLFSLMFQILIAAPNWLTQIAYGAAGLDNGIVLIAIFCGLYAVAAAAALRLLILFPALAVEAPGAGWRNAVADTEGHAWRVLFVMLVTAIPIFGLQSALPDFQSYTLIHLDSWINNIWCFVLNEKECWKVPSIASSRSLAKATDWVFSITYAVIEIFAFCAFAAAASRLYAAFANRLNVAASAR